MKTLAERVASLEVIAELTAKSVQGIDEKLDKVIACQNTQRGFAHAIGVLWLLITAGGTLLYNWIKRLN